MNETTEQREDTDEEILTFEVSDEALEAAAGPVAAIPTYSINIVPPNCC